MSNYFPEVLAAARWWADVMSTPGLFQDNGDALTGGMATLFRDRIPALSADERLVFERELCDRLQEYVSQGDNWERATREPGWGSAFRCVGVDYGPDSVLQAAADRIAGNDPKQAARLSLLWPIKTHMWINPGNVTVQHGYGAKRTQIYGATSVESAAG